jgi:YVTN family beta-propeller protein
MKRNWVVNLVITLCLVISLCSSPQSTVQARTGGPETAGYVYVDSDEIGGPAYDLIDISSTGTAIQLGNNAVSSAIDLTFPFNFFGVDYTQIYVSDNGYVSFLSGQTSQPTAGTIPSRVAPNAIIAGWWGDLKPNYGGTITYQVLGSAPSRVFLLQYQDVPYALLSLGAKVSFEIKLFETTQVIEVHYDSAPVYSDTSNNVYANSAGIENADGTLGLQYYYGTDGLAADLAVRYTPFVGVALEPASIIGYGAAGQTKSYPMSIYNWTGQSDTFNISVANQWTYRLSADTTGPLDQGKEFDFTLEVDFPPDALPADYDSAVITVQSQADPASWSDTSSIITAVPRVGYLASGNDILFVDTKFHQDLGNPLNLENYSVFNLAMALDSTGKHLYSVLAGGTDDQGNGYPGLLLGFNTDDMSQAPNSVAIGADSSSVAASFDGKYVLTSSYDDGTVSIVDADPDSPTYFTVLKTLTVGKQPMRVATSPCLNKAYVTNQKGNSVSVIDLETLNVISTITGLNGPWGIVVAPSGELAYVTNNSDGKIGLIDTVTDTLRTTWNVGGSSLEDLDLTDNGSHLYTAGSSNILDVNTATGTVAHTIANTAAGLYSIDVFPDAYGPYAYITNGTERSISVLDTSSNAITQTVVFDGAPGGMALFPPRSDCKQPPIAAFGPASLVAQVGVGFAFDNNSIRNPTSSTWDFGDGSPVSHDTNPVHTYTSVGPYTVTLTVENEFGTNTTSRTINFKPKASFTPTQSLINPGDSISFTDASTGEPTLKYKWDFGDGSTVSTAQSPQHTYAKVGNYTVTETVTNTYGSDSATGLVVFSAKAAFSPVTNVIQAGDSITFTNATTGSTPLSYTWDFGDGSSTSTDTSPTHTYADAGSYTVTLQASNTWSNSSASGTVNFKPKAAFGPAQSKIKAGDSVTFTNTSTGTAPLTYTWDFGDNSPTSSAEIPTHTYTKTGVYTVTLKVDNAYGTDSSTGSVVFPPIAAFSPANAVIQAGGAVSFTNASAGSSPMTYSWNFGDGSAASTDPNPTHAYPTAGDYTVTLTTTNDYGSTQATGTVHFKPKASFIPLDDVIQLGDQIDFTNHSTGSGTLTYTWDFGDGTAVSHSANPAHTYAALGSYTVSLEVSNSYGSDTLTSTVNFRPIAGFTPVHPVLHAGDAVSFVDTSSGPGDLTYVWNFGDGSPVSNDPSPSHIYATVGEFTVELTVTNEHGSDSATGKVDFYPTAGFAASKSVIRLGESITFTNQSSGTGPLTNYWDFGDGETSAEVNPTHLYAATGSYTVSLTTTNTYGDSSASKTVNFAPTADFSFTPQTSIKQGMEITFTNHSNGTGALVYTWDFGDGSPVSHATSPKHTFSTRGSLTVKLTVAGDYGEDTLEKSILVDPHQVHVSLTNDDGVSQVFSGTGLTITLHLVNTGPEDLIGASLSDTLPAWLTKVQWTCQASAGSLCQASGSGNILSDSVTILNGGDLTYTIQAIVVAPAGTVLSNTASLSIPPAYQNLVSSGNTITHTTLVLGGLYLPMIRQ